MVLELDERIALLEERLEKSERLEKCPRCGDRFLASNAEGHGKIHALTDDLELTNDRFPRRVGGLDLAIDGHPHIDHVFGRTEELTISSDVMPQPRRKSVILNAETGTTDDLDGITVRNVVEGFAFLLSPTSTDTITVKHKNAGASSGERISSTTAGDFSVAPGESALIWYDSVSDSTNPWHAAPFIAAAGGGGGTAHEGLTFGAELTIATGRITKTDQAHTVDTESDASTDNLASMAGGTNGDIVQLFAADSARTIVIKHNDSGEGAANERFFTLDDGDIELDTIFQSAMFFKVAAGWLEITRATLASLTAAGFVRLATASEINTATDDTRAMSPGQLAEVTGQANPASNTTPSSIQGKWASKTGDAHVVLARTASGKVGWVNLFAYDIKTPVQILTFSDGLASTFEIDNAGTRSPSFTLTYEGTPSACTISMNAQMETDLEVTGADYPQDLTGDFGVTAEAGAAIKNAITAAMINRTYTWTATATIDGTGGLTATTTLRWLNRKYFGPSTQESTLSSAQVLALDATGDGGSSLDADYKGTFVVNADQAGEYIWFAFRDQLQTDDGNPTFTVGGFPGGFTDKGTVSHTNDSGFTETYRLWRSDNAALGSTTVVVT